MKQKFLFLSFLLVCAGILNMSGQGYLHTDGNRIVNGQGENTILRSVGTGNWMLQEGYMMKSTGAAGTQHAFREKLIENIGITRTDSFYSAWLNNHMTRRDIDSMSAWGFNAIRPALHYKWFTLPIEEEPVRGEQTWLNTGFTLMDSLVEWCSGNEMYVIFDMHGTPGGQGANADISDYDPSKPSLWESELNKTKLVALWRKIAERYAEEPWVGGYDLINETNWEFQEGNNSQMMELYKRITDTIREVDENHIIYIEGNWFANDFGNLTPPWDDNLVYSFHKYWSYNDEDALDYATWLRDQYNVPLWLGETGENSNTWFTNLIALSESENIGWSFWPVKKGAVNNILNVNFNEDYLQLISSWKGQTSKMDTAEAFQAVMQLAEKHRFENCRIQYDVIDAMFRQPTTTKCLPYGSGRLPGDRIYFTEYDFGRNNFAYYDHDTADYHGDTEQYTDWNTGGVFRNDGVDIQECQDGSGNNGFNVGWTAPGEWMAFTMKTDSAVMVDGEIRYAGASGTGGIVFEINDTIVSENIQLSSTGGWQTWKTISFNNVILPKGEFQVRVRITSDGVNLNYFRFTNFRSVSMNTAKALFCETSKVENDLFLHLNTDADGTVYAEDFVLRQGSEEIPVISADFIGGSGRVIRLEPERILQPGSELRLDYNGNSLLAGDEPLPVFADMPVANLLDPFPTLPARIEAEDFTVNNGFELEECTDASGGYNTAYADAGDYLDYRINVTEETEFQLSLRAALNGGNATIRFYHNNDGDFTSIKSFTLSNTGGWQNWQLQNTLLTLPEGKYLFRIMAVGNPFNLNWIKFSPAPASTAMIQANAVKIYPNPTGNILHIDMVESNNTSGSFSLYNIQGKEILSRSFETSQLSIDMNSVPSGIYLLQLLAGNERQPSYHKVVRK